MAATDRKENRIYMGRRFTDGKVKQCFEVPSGATSVMLKPLNFPVIVGDVYEFTVLEDGRTWVTGEDKPKRIGGSVTKELEEIESWRMMDRAAMIERDAAKAIKRLQDEFEIDEHIIAIRKAINAKWNPSYRRAVLGYIADKLFA